MFRPLCLVPDLSLKKEMNNEKHKCLHLVTMPTFGVKTRTDRLPMIVEINKLHKWLFSSKFNFFAGRSRILDVLGDYLTAMTGVFSYGGRRPSQNVYLV